jgi:hypothetical protein
MENKDQIPRQTKGAQTDTQHSVSFGNENEAISNYQEAKNRLFNVSKWHSYAGSGTADFQLADSNGEPVFRPARQGDHFRINIPGPGLKTGDGEDWVQIENIGEVDEMNSNRAYIVVRPATNPLNTKSDTAHFFKDEATSTFIIRRDGNTVSAEVHGRNELPNTENESLIDKARNVVVALGAMAGMSKLQWGALTRGLIDPQIKD